MALASPHLKPSRVVGAALSQDRKSSSCFFTGEAAQHPLIKNLEDKLAALALNASSMEGRSTLLLKEATQVIRYTKGEFYGLHRDNSEITPATESSLSTPKGWRPHRRSATVIVYLNTPKAGGETFFPYAEAATDKDHNENNNAMCIAPEILAKHGVEVAVPNGGVAVHPREGYALLFWSVLPDGEDDELAAHSAEPVWMGEKWIATRWCFEAS